MRERAYEEGLKDSIKLSDRDVQYLLKAYKDIRRRIMNLVSYYGIYVYERPLYWYYKGFLDGLKKILRKYL